MRLTHPSLIDLAPISPIESIDPDLLIIVAGVIVVIAVVAVVLIVRSRRNKAAKPSASAKHFAEKR